MGSKINKAQFDLIAEKLKLDNEKARACELVIIDGKTVYAAEKEVYGKIVTIVGRVVKRINGLYDFAMKINIKQNTPDK
jgi:hypothetical protein